MDAIDWDQVAGVLDFADPECLEIYDEFLEMVSEELVALRDAGTGGEHATVVELAHRLRGSCLTFGFSGLGHVLKAVETSAKAHGDLSADSWYAEATAAFSQARAAVDLRRPK